MGTLPEVLWISKNNENVFLFWLNIIGISRRAPVRSHSLIQRSRIYSDHSWNYISTLHAPSSASLFRFVQNFMFARCGWWICCTRLRKTNKIWYCTRHGDRSMYNDVLACLPSNRVAKVRSRLPNSYIARPTKTLLPDVCYVGRGLQH